MAVSNLATSCIEDLQSKIQSVPAFQNKVFWVYTEDKLYDKAAQLNFPCAGILYEGLRSVPDAEGSNTAKGLSAVLQASVILLVSGSTIGGADYNISAIQLMDQFRNSIKGTRSPANHFWKFVIESPVESQEGVYSYIQRWSTPVILT